MKKPPVYGHDDETTMVTRTPGAGSVAPKLSIVIIGGDLVARHPIPPVGDIVIGRAHTQCAIVVDDPSVSRRHAVLHMGPPMTIEDLGSSNGTRVRGDSLEPGESLPVAIDEVIELGSLLMIVQQRQAPVRTRRLWTHDYFEARLEDECARSARSGGKFTLARLHCDPKLPSQAVLELLAGALRPTDVIGLYGPGEYELLLVETSKADSEAILTRVRERLGSRGGGHMGVASYPIDGRSPDELVARACHAVSGDQLPAIDADAPVSLAGSSMANVSRLVERIAAGTLSVLILGETGVGKELMAERIHKLSPRNGKPFLRLNCAALSETLLESELFGHEKGAFTGAVAAKVGLLESAQGGTVFLDEVGDLPLPVQVKLLRVIEQRQVLPVGSVKPRAIDVRFVAATNKDLEAETARGMFRQDLYFRLNGVAITIPPLRERVSEIASLARTFLEQASRQAHRDEVPAMTPEARSLLERYSWPGNIRELRNVMERAVLLAMDGPIEPQHLPVEKMRTTFASRVVPARPPSARPSDDEEAPPEDEFDEAEETTPVEDLTGLIPLSHEVKRETQALERRRILDALAKCAGNQTRAARLLGISRRTLIKRLDAFGLSRPRKTPQ